ncbi:MAG: hypothetical protein KA807_03770 [Prolixibacteraceae bacterium]|nr:hypothetical protein [Prolixibacteraceae bacterium]
MKKLFIITLLAVAFLNSFSQNYITRTAHINVMSLNNVQNIVADNYQVASQLNTSTGQFKIIALIKSFEYRIGAMNRMMSARDIDVTDYPKITFDGRISDMSKVNFNKPGTYNVKFSGTFYVWDEQTSTDINGSLTIGSDGTITGKSEFAIPIESLDPKKIEQILKEKLPSSLNVKPNAISISKNIQVKFNSILKKQ